MRVRGAQGADCKQQRSANFASADHPAQSALDRYSTCVFIKKEELIHKVAHVSELCEFVLHV